MSEVFKLEDLENKKIAYLENKVNAIQSDYNTAISSLRDINEQIEELNIMTLEEKEVVRKTDVLLQAISSVGYSYRNIKNSLYTIFNNN